MSNVTSARRPPHRALRVIATGLLCVLAQGAGAQPENSAQATRQACMADYDRFCSDVQPGGGRVKACLKQNARSLSPECREALDAANRL
jgi:hypothetical protein